MLDDGISIEDLNVLTDIAYSSAYYGTWFVFRNDEWYYFTIKTTRFHKYNYFLMAETVSEYDISKMINHLAFLIDRLNIYRKNSKE